VIDNSFHDFRRFHGVEHPTFEVLIELVEDHKLFEIERTGFRRFLLKLVMSCTMMSLKSQSIVCAGILFHLSVSHVQGFVDDGSAAVLNRLKFLFHRKRGQKRKRELKKVWRLAQKASRNMKKKGNQDENGNEILLNVGNKILTTRLENSENFDPASVDHSLASLEAPELEIPRALSKSRGICSKHRAILVQKFHIRD